MQLKTKLSREKIERLTDRLLSERENNLKRVLEIDHRLETVCEQDGVEYINDSKATDVSATLYSLQCLEKPVIWIMSCTDRYSDLSRLKSMVEQKVKAMIYVGAQDDELVEEFIDSASLIVRADSLEEALIEAARLGLEGDAVLFSPASPSGDLYDSYKQRGEAFSTILLSDLPN
jgi:UDP-N-acetylmuramoylalanine--D-glutamate ligase